tara:strand:- start:205 stop:552 length:348 start_codon:yes stop_codon:yes gene_type:complete
MKIIISLVLFSLIIPNLSLANNQVSFNSAEIKNIGQKTISWLKEYLIVKPGQGIVKAWKWTLEKTKRLFQKEMKDKDQEIKQELQEETQEIQQGLSGAGESFWEKTKNFFNRLIK